MTDNHRNGGSFPISNTGQARKNINFNGLQLNNALVSGIIEAGNPVVLDVPTGLYQIRFDLGVLQYITNTAAGLNFSFANYSDNNNTLKTALFRLTNGGLGSVAFGTLVNWVLPDGTYTTNVNTYLSSIGRPTFKTSGVDFFFFWNTGDSSGPAGTGLYGKLL